MLQFSFFYFHRKNLVEVSLLIKDVDLTLYKEKQVGNSFEIQKFDLKQSYRYLTFTYVFDRGNKLIIGLLVLDNLEKSILETYVGDWQNTPYPYISGFLSLRYKEKILFALKNLKSLYDALIIFPGAGIQHPRYFGLASDLGLTLNTSTIGLTKSPLIGTTSERLYQKIGPIEIFDVYFKKKVIAKFLKHEKNIQGVFVSIGNHICIDTATKLIVENLKYRLPEPLRYLKGLILKKASVNS